MTREILTNPIVALEICALFMTVWYMARLVAEHKSRKQVTLKKPVEKFSYSNEKLLDLFNVGSFISTPKKSLPGKTTLRLLTARQASA